jgi:hypothetical protein
MIKTLYKVAWASRTLTTFHEVIKIRPTELKNNLFVNNEKVINRIKL